MPLAGHDPEWSFRSPLQRNFNPRAPCGARPSVKSYTTIYNAFQSTCPLRGTTTFCDHLDGECVSFQSTCPLRGTTKSMRPISSALAYFNPRAPCGARPPIRAINPDGLPISIHVPLAGHDPFLRISCRIRRRFQSTCPLRGTTKNQPADGVQISDFNPRAPCGARPGSADGIDRSRGTISIHVPLAGHDRLTTTSAAHLCNFNPRAPCGARPCSPFFASVDSLFQSTCPLRGTTGHC